MPTNKMKKPKSGGKPKRITTKNAPGGPMTPGAKAKTGAEEAAARSLQERDNPQ